jgi:YD repeat-containing protein
VKNVTTEKMVWTSFKYNAINEQIEARDDLGHATVSMCDNFGRRISRVHQDAGETKYTYDIAGNLTQLETANLLKEGLAIQYSYNFERLTEITYPQNPENNVKYTYGSMGDSDNRAGRIVLQEDASGAQEFFYGPLGEVVKNIRTVVIPQHGEQTYVTEWKRVEYLTYLEIIRSLYLMSICRLRLTVKEISLEFVRAIKLIQSMNGINMCKSSFRIKLVFLKITVISLLVGCRSADNEVIVVPENYEGYVVIVYGQEHGTAEQYEGTSRLYNVPSTGILLTQFSNNPGWAELPKVYRGSITRENEIPFIASFEKIPEDKICAFGGTSGAANKDLAGDEVVRFKQLYVGSKSRIRQAIEEAEKLDIIGLTK